MRVADTFPRLARLGEGQSLDATEEAAGAAMRLTGEAVEVPVFIDGEERRLLAVVLAACDMQSAAPF